MKLTTLVCAISVCVLVACGGGEATQAEKDAFAIEQADMTRQAALADSLALRDKKQAETHQPHSGPSNLGYSDGGGGYSDGGG